MNVKRGDLVLADLPYSDRSGSKKRPALVVQCDRNNQRLEDGFVRVSDAGNRTWGILKPFCTR